MAKKFRIALACTLASLISLHVAAAEDPNTPATDAVAVTAADPDVPLDELQGYAVTRLGLRHRAESVTRTQDPRGRTIYWLGAAGAEADCGPGTDFHAITRHQVSVTPITVDLTRHAALDRLRDWVSDL